MNRLTVLFDQECRLCEAVVRRLRSEESYIELEFIAAAAPRAAKLFPEIVSSVPLSEVVAIADGGEVYRGDAAWLMVLWAMKRTRAMSLTLAQPLYRGLVRRAVASVGKHRLSLSRLIREDALQNGPRRPAAVGSCTNASCGTAHSSASPVKGIKMEPWSEG